MVIKDMADVIKVSNWTKNELTELAELTREKI